MSDYHRRRYATDSEFRARGLARAAAQSAAKTRLVQLYPTIYAALYSEELERVFAERGLS